MSATPNTFGKLIDLIDTLPLAQRESLVEVIRRRNSEESRQRIASSVRSAKREHRKGKSKAVSAEQLMREILD